MTVNVNDYTNAMDIDPTTGKVMPKMELAGRNAIPINLANAVSIRDTTTHYFPGNAISYATSSTQDVSSFGDKDILIYNGHDQAATIYIYSDISQNPTNANNRATIVSADSLPAGGTKLYSIKDYPMLKDPLLFLNVAIIHATAPTTGSVTVNLLVAPR